MPPNFIYTFQDCFSGTKPMLRLIQCKWSDCKYRNSTMQIFDKTKPGSYFMGYSVHADTLATQTNSQIALEIINSVHAFKINLINIHQGYAVMWYRIWIYTSYYPHSILCNVILIYDIISIGQRDVPGTLNSIILIGSNYQSMSYI